MIDPAACKPYIGESIPSLSSWNEEDILCHYSFGIYAFACSPWNSESTIPSKLATQIPLVSITAILANYTSRDLLNYLSRIIIYLFINLLYMAIKKSKDTFSVLSRRRIEGEQELGQDGLSHVRRQNGRVEFATFCCVCARARVVPVAMVVTGSNGGQPQNPKQMPCDYTAFFALV